MPLGCFTFKAVKDVAAVGDKFEQLKEEARAAQAAQEAKEAAVLAAAEERRRQQEEEAEARRQEVQAATEKKKVALAKVRRIVAAMKNLSGDTGKLLDKLSALDDEEAELLRRLASGELTPEEEAAVRARLAEIEAERKLLQANLKANRLDTEIAELNRKLAALDEEEAELMRRLAAGDLSPEEEAAIRKRLAEIAAERGVLLEQLAAKAAEQLHAAGDARALELAAKLAAIERKLGMLDDEEAELLRRLAAGDLTPEEEAAIRKRLAEIAAEREALLREKSSILAAEHAARIAQRKLQDAAMEAELKRKLAALDDEEAELRRRLAAGDLTPEEEAAIRKRLAEIEAERASLQAQLLEAEVRSKQAQLADIDRKLAALDDEEAELLRRLAAGDLTPEEEAAIRKRLAEIAAEREALLHLREATAEQLQAAETAAAEAAAAAAAAEENLRPESPIGPLGGRPIYTTACPPAINPIWTPNTRSSWAFHAKDRGASRMLTVTRTRGGLNPLGEVSKRAKIVSCRHCLHGVCPDCKRTMTDPGHAGKRPPHRLSRLAGTKSASPVVQSDRAADLHSGFASPSPERASPKKLLPPLGREGAIVLESRLSTRAYSRSQSLLERADGSGQVRTSASAVDAAESNRESRRASLAQRHSHASPAKTLSSPG